MVDVSDVITAALALADAGEADGKRLGIRGGSAGGWTALAAVTSGIGAAGFHPGREAVFAAVSYAEGRIRPAYGAGPNAWVDTRRSSRVGQARVIVELTVVCSAVQLRDLPGPDPEAHVTLHGH